MPKELNISPNQRIDLEDFEYGSRTFTVDSLRAQITRLVSGGYRGGFVLEGFQVEVSSTATNLFISVTNGIALDRAGRLVTFEEGDYFLNNPLATKQIQLLEASAKNYVMVEYTLADGDGEERAFWDPTYPSSAITDSGGDLVPVPKGKEFNLSVVTRKAQSWTPIVSATGFEDAVDPNKLRIPIAIIPVDTAAKENLLPGGASGTSVPFTSLTEKPLSRLKTSPWTPQTIQYLQCADTRLFPATGAVSLKPREWGAAGVSYRWFNDGTGVNTQTIRYVNNDRQNNRLYLAESISVPTGNDADGFPFDEPEITDVVIQVSGGGSVPAHYVEPGSKYDCRPMFYAVTEPEGSREEDPNDWPVNIDGERKSDSRQYKYWSGLSLLSSKDATILTKYYPPTTDYGYQTMASNPVGRTELRIKQNQDFVRVIASLVEEMKYGAARRKEGAWSENEVGSTFLASFGVTTAGGKYLIDTHPMTAVTDDTALFTQELVGATVRILTGANAGSRLTVGRVYGDSILEFQTSAANPFLSGDQYEIEINYPAEGHQYVDAIEIGSLNEVYKARIDQYSQTYAGDLSRRLTSNKVATLTVGDGVHTFGDYNGDLGIRAAFKQAFAQKQPTTIFIKAGSYLLGDVTTGLPDITEIGPGTTVVGEGIGVTTITLHDNDPAKEKYFLLRDYDEKYSTPATSSAAEITVAGVSFRDLSIKGGLGPVLSNCPLQFENSPGLAGGGAYSGGSWRTKWASGSNTASKVENLSFVRVEIQGGSVGSWSTGEDASYAIYMGADNSRHLLTPYNAGIFFNGCIIENGGGAILLNDCVNTTITDCQFEGSIWAIEGITVCSRREQVLAAPVNRIKPSVRPGGNLSITGCKFVGELRTEAASALYPASNKRGWITFTPTYIGIKNSISDCSFGEAPSYSTLVHTGYPYITDQVQPSNMTGITKCSPFDLEVKGCIFSGMTHATIHNGGTLNIKDCRFDNVPKSYLVNGQYFTNEWNFGVFSGGIATNADDNYWNYDSTGPSSSASILSYWDPVSGNGPVQAKISNCDFTGFYTGSGTQISNQPGTIDVQPTTGQPFTGGLSNADGLSVVTKSLWRTLTIDGCTFKEITAGVTYQSVIKLTNANNFFITSDSLVRNWDLLEFTNNEFIGVPIAVVSNSVNLYDPGTRQRDWSGRYSPIFNVVYNGNNHHQSVFSTTAVGANAYTGFTATHVEVSNNTFTEIRSETAAASDLNPIVWIGSGQSGFTFSDNKFWDCYPAENNSQITMLSVGILESATNYLTVGNIAASSASASTFYIHNNIFRPKALGSSTGRVSNGVYFESGITETITSLLDIAYQTGNFPGVLHTPACEGFHFGLSFKGNDLYLRNGNFGLLSRQDFQYNSTQQTFVGGYGNIWAWLFAEVCNNSIVIDIKDESNNFQHGNDIRGLLKNIEDIDVGGGAQTIQGGVPYNYLGASNANLPTYFFACVDLRLMYKGVTVGDGRSQPSVVKDNSFQIINNSAVGFYQGTDAQDVVERVGLRISKFPDKLDVKNNTFSSAPLILRWTWNNPYHVSSAIKTPGACLGFNFSINNNTFNGDPSSNRKVPLHVDINPAIGFGTQVGALANRIVSSTNTAKVTFNNNTVTNYHTTLLSKTYPFFGVVRFWFPELNSWVGQNAAGAATVPSAVNVAFANWLSTDTAGGAPGGFGWNQSYASASLEAHGNHLENSYFIMTKDISGGLIASTGFAATSEMAQFTGYGGNGTANMYHLINIDNTFLANYQTSVVGTETTASATSLFGHFTTGTATGPSYGRVNENNSTVIETYVLRVGTTVLLLGRQSNPTIKIINGSYENTNDLITGGSYIDGIHGP